MAEVLIIGAGPAGMAAALQLRRHGIPLHLFEQSRPGGLLWNANWVENYPGFPGGVSGPQLVRKFIDQLGEIDIIPERVTRLEWEKGLFTAETPQASYSARLAVIASGTRPCPLTGLNIPAGLRDRVFYEVADLLDADGKDIVVVGSGDAAFDYAINLSQKNSVIILNRSQQVKCLPLLWERALANKNLIYHPATLINRLVEQPGGGMVVECSSPHGQAEYQADFLVGAVGRQPQLDFLSASVRDNTAELEQMGILHTIGDVKNGMFRQTAIAVGDGIRTAMHIYQVLKENADESDCLNR